MKNYAKKESKRNYYIPLNDDDKYFYTYDLGCCSALISKNFQLVSLDKTKSKVLFIFLKEVGMEKIIDDYWADRLDVKARTLFDNIKMLKNRIYSE
jgi:hypothetical protein